jgi:hypothetical protein
MGPRPQGVVELTIRRDNILFAHARPVRAVTTSIHLCQTLCGASSAAMICDPRIAVNAVAKTVLISVHFVHGCDDSAGGRCSVTAKGCAALRHAKICCG